jgi:hypothetical protein
MKSRIVIASLSIVLANVRAMADQQPPSDVDLIPDAAIQQPEAAPSSSIDRGNQRIYLEDALTGSDIRNNLLVPYPSPQPTDWQERVFLDARKDWKLDDDLHLNLSNRFNIRAESDITFPSHETVLDEFREAYVSWEPQERTYLDVGRINVKSGIALGFNPTDFFKTRAVVDPLSVDPTVLREDRLGTLMIEGQRIWEGGAVTAAFAPKLENPTALYTNTDLRTFDPSFDRTNASNRALIKADVNLTHEFAPEFLFDREGDRSSFGTNLTGAIGQRTVVYGEWSGGNRPSRAELRTDNREPAPPGNGPATCEFQCCLSVVRIDRRLVHDRCKNHLQPRISPLPAGLLQERLEHLVSEWDEPCADRWHSGGALVHTRLCA